jgi:ABC-type lipoprotein export system ATPase subunit
MKKTILLVTHDPHAAERAQRVVHLEKGQLLESAEMEAAGLAHAATASTGIQRDRS